jgi:uncharacterized protein (UPF0276 family)
MASRYNIELGRFPAAGIGLRHVYYREVLETRPAAGWFEVHPENYFGGGAHRHFLGRVRAHYPVSFHGVGLSLGSPERVSRDHLRQLRELVELFDPFQLSDHASWSRSGNAHFNDLLPLPYTQETLAALCRNIEETQEFLGRRILIENPSTYLKFSADEMSEWEFLNEAARRTGCGLLLDINNIYVQAHNHGIDARAYIAGINADAVGEMHLAGHSARPLPGGGTLLVDTHDSLVRPEVWALYRLAAARFGAVPTLIEWDQNFPPLATLLAEARRAEAIQQEASREVA